MAAEPDAVPSRSCPSVLLVSTDWREWDITSSMVTVNSIVAQCLTSTRSDILLNCTVVQFQDSIPAEVKAAADRANVRLIGCERPRRVSAPKKDWLTRFWEQHYPRLVNGHNFSHIIGYFPQTAKTALSIRDRIRRRGAECTCVLFIEDSRREELTEESAKLINQANTVYTLGPLLFREYNRHISRPHRMIFPVPYMGDHIATFHPHTPGTVSPIDIVTFYPENGIPGPDEEYQHKTLVLVIKAISNVAKSYFGRCRTNNIEWHIYGVPDECSVQEQLKAVIREHSVFPELTWRLHKQPADCTRILQLASLCVIPWHSSYDPNALYPLLYGVPTLMCASSGVAEMFFNDVPRNDDGSTLLTPMAVVNCSGDTGGDGWTAKIHSIISNPVDAGADFLELGRRIRESTALQEGMRAFSVATFGGQDVQLSSNMAALGQRPVLSPSTSTGVQHHGHPGQIGRPVLGRRTTQTDISGPSPSPRPGHPIPQGNGGPSPGPGPHVPLGDGRGNVKPWTDVNKYTRLVVDSENVYTMTASPRGYAFIININKVQGVNEERKGSEVDEHNFCNLFTQLNFLCITNKDLTRQGILDELNTVACSEALWHHNCLVICLMSHGKEGVIFASDNREVAVTEILEIFSRCEALKGKPKLIFIQACRGKHTEKGETRADGPTDNAAARRPPVMSDMLVVYPSSLGYRSYRNTVHGSWLISKLMQVFSEHACEEHIIELLTRVLREVSQMETSGRDVATGSMEQPEAHWALRKLLYFFPGM